MKPNPNRSTRLVARAEHKPDGKGKWRGVVLTRYDHVYWWRPVRGDVRRPRWDDQRWLRKDDAIAHALRCPDFRNVTLEKTVLQKAVEKARSKARARKLQMIRNCNTRL